MAKNKIEVVETKPYFSKAKKKNGKPARIGTVCVDSDGNSSVVLTPNGKGAKYAAELKNGKRYTNVGKVKVDGNGEPMGLSKTQRAYRSGYLQARKDSSNAYKAKENNRKKSN